MELWVTITFWCFQIFNCMCYFFIWEEENILNKLPINIDSVIRPKKVLLSGKLSFSYCTFLHRWKKYYARLLSMGIGQEGTPLNPLSGDNDHYLVSDRKRLEIQQLWVCFTMQTFKLVSLVGNTALKKMVRSKQREIWNICKWTTKMKGLHVKSPLI